MNRLRIQLNIYASEKKLVRYCDEPGVTHVGRLVIPMPNPDGLKRADRKVIVDVLIGNTEIKVKARDVISGKALSASINYFG